jgi:hypothetical protein
MRAFIQTNQIALLVTVNEKRPPEGGRFNFRSTGVD